MTLDKVLMHVPDGVFERQWPLRVADIDRYGRLRLDATARHIQDIGQDQLRESDLKPSLATLLSQSHPIPLCANESAWS
jgi:acyl-ACP thioesterase